MSFKILAVLIWLGISKTIVLIPGLGDDCSFPSMMKLKNIFQTQTGDHSLCIQYHNLGVLPTYMTRFQGQAYKSCKELQENEDLNGEELVLIGFSQGALIARYIIEDCQLDQSIIQYISVGGPQMGYSALPYCSESILCFPINLILRSFVYLDIVQFYIGPAGYFRDYRQPLEFKKTFLAQINNQNNVLQCRKDNMIKLEKMMLIKFNRDRMVYPKESQWFQELDQFGNLLALEESDFYQKDLLGIIQLSQSIKGIKTLNEANKITFVSIDSGHLSLSTKYINEIILPFIQSD